MKLIFCYLKGTMYFGWCFRKNIEDAITSKVHFDEDVNCS